MHELHAILDAWRAHRDSAVLATVAHVTGSAYRRPGARMLMLPNGGRVGSISGGCLEGDVSKKAWWWTEDGRPTVRVYDTSSEDDAVWEFGLGCNGVIHVLLERVENPATRMALEFLDLCRQSRKEAVMATVIHRGGNSRLEVGDRWFQDDSGVSGGSLKGTAAEREIRSLARSCLRERKSRLVHMADAQLFVEFIGRPLSLVVFGAGHDALPVVLLAQRQGWRVTVADGRQPNARPERFPEADRVILTSARDPLAGIEIGPDTAVVLMTHDFSHDEKLLRAILPKRPKYLGLLGPRNRAERLFRNLGERMGPSVHAPVGLDLGIDTPESIALSIVAEVTAVQAGRTAGFLRYRGEPIHAPVEEAGERSNEVVPALADLGVCENSVASLG
jgi:xanthine/CO dehydrogenase XdhC/CoxF family maturation factor